VEEEETEVLGVTGLVGARVVVEEEKEVGDKD